jgi:enoyl-CoA hydratase
MTKPTDRPGRSIADGSKWELGEAPNLATPIPDTMTALTLHRDQYGPPSEALRFEEVAAPRLEKTDAGRVLVSILATGPNFNTNFAALGLPVPPFAFVRGDFSSIHIPGSDAVGIVVDAGPAVTRVKVGQAVILDSWTGFNIRGYETHDGFHAQFAVVDEERAIPVPPALRGDSPERLAALMLTWGTAYRAVVRRLQVKPGDALLVMGGGKGTSFAGAQLGKALGARVILVGSNPALGSSLIERGIADAFVDRREIPAEVFGVLEPDEDYDAWHARTEPFRKVILAANDGRPVDKIFEHTGGRNFPLLVSILADDGILAFFGATGQGLKGEYKETFFYNRRRFVMDARWVWMRQKQIIIRRTTPREIFSEIGLLPGRRGLIWGADAYAQDFAAAALERKAELAVIASRSSDAEGIAALVDLGVPETSILDRDSLELADDMPDPLTDEGTPNPAYGKNFMKPARALGKAVWGVFGPRISPDFIVERPDQSTMHYSTFLLRDYDERNAMTSGYIVVQGATNRSILGSHMYCSSEARETVRLLAEGQMVMGQEDLEIVNLAEIPAVQQKMLDGTMTKPKGVALVQADRSQRSVADYEAEYLGPITSKADPAEDRYLEIRLVEGIGFVTLTRPKALNALSEELIAQLAEVIGEVESASTLCGETVEALVLRGAGRSFVAGADIQGFVGKSAGELEKLCLDSMAIFTRLENLAVPVVSLVDGFALGGGNELAMSTHYRIVTENALIGQPEVKLGIIPGYGGMQRLPRLIGPRRAAELCVNGEPITGAEAFRLGLAHELHPSSSALKRAFEVARALASGRLTHERSDWDSVAAAQQGAIEELFAHHDAASLLATQAPTEEEAAQVEAARRYAARFALEALRSGYELGFEAGLANDARLFGEVATSESGQHWVGRFLAKDPRQSSFLTLLPPDQV